MLCHYSGKWWDSFDNEVAHIDSLDGLGLGLSGGGGGIGGGFGGGGISGDLGCSGGVLIKTRSSGGVSLTGGHVLVVEVILGLHLVKVAVLAVGSLQVKSRHGGSGGDDGLEHTNN